MAPRKAKRSKDINGNAHISDAESTSESIHEVPIDGETGGSRDTETAADSDGATEAVEIQSDEGAGITEAETDQPPESELEKLRRERDELDARYLRVSADYQNFVRRSQQNIDSAREQQVMALAKSLVTVLDHFDRALEVEPEKTSASDLLDGVQIVRDELLKTLEQFGVRRLEVSPGDPFDPTYHEALMRQAVDGLEPNRVAAQMQPGYTLGDKALRPAKVSLTE